MLLTPPFSCRLAAEGIGTFFLVLIGPGAVMVDASTGGGLGVAGIALAFAFVVTAMAATFGGISGAHINPAVSVAMAWRGRLALKELPAYVGVQLLGAIAGSLVLEYLLVRAGHSGATLPSIGTARTLVLEGVMSFGLALVVLRGRGSFAPLGAGLTVGFCALVGGPLTGASMNPARSFGPALVGGEWTGHWIYWVAPIVGMLLAAVVDRWLAGATPGGEGAGARE